MSSEPNPVSARTYLAVPYEARNQVKSIGGRWDREAKAWYVPPDKSAEPFKQWARTTPPLIAEADPRELFADELRAAGFRLSGAHPIMDGKIHRIQVDGDKGAERNGSYRGFLDGVPNGWHQNFKTTDRPVPWKASAPTRTLSAEERAAHAATAAAKRAEDAKHREQVAEQAAQKAIEILAAAAPAVGHAYLTAKQVRAEGLFIAAPGTTIETDGERSIDITGRLLVPVRDVNGSVTSLQIIDDQGAKMFLPGGKIGGGQHVIGKPDSPWPIMIAEGYATAATLRAATGHTVAIAFNAHNLATVAAQHRAVRPERSIFIAGDNDHHLPGQFDAQGKPKRNVGLEAATAAAAAVNAYALTPSFQPGDKGTDWNDAMKQRGMAQVQLELAERMAQAARQKITRDIAQDRANGRTKEREHGRDTGRGRT
jgi:phage/plasmid primase-like uncharacterized protein